MANNKLKEIFIKAAKNNSAEKKLSQSLLLLEQCYKIENIDYCKGSNPYENMQSIIKTMSPSELCVFIEECKSSNTCKIQNEILKKCEDEGWKNITNPITNKTYTTETQCFINIVSDKYNMLCTDTYDWMCKCTETIICDGKKISNDTISEGLGYLAGETNTTNSTITAVGQDCIIANDTSELS